MVNLRLGSIAPDFEAETSTGDIKVSPSTFRLDYSEQVADASAAVDVNAVLRLGWGIMGHALLPPCK
jgi:hypothetical protein